MFCTFLFQPCIYKDEFYIDNWSNCNTPICDLEIVKNKESVLFYFLIIIIIMMISCIIKFLMIK